jgi:hypothetical protein
VKHSTQQRTRRCDIFELTDAQLVTLGIGGAILVAGCMIETISPITIRLIGFVVGIIMLAIALVEMVTD